MASVVIIIVAIVVGGGAIDHCGRSHRGRLHQGWQATFHSARKAWRRHGSKVVDEPPGCGSQSGDMLRNKLIEEHLLPVCASLQASAQ